MPSRGSRTSVEACDPKRAALDSLKVGGSSSDATTVLPFDIESVVAFGGRLPDGSAFTVVAFSSVPIEASSVPAFEAIGLSATVAMLVRSSCYDTRS